MKPTLRGAAVVLIIATASAQGLRPDVLLLARVKAHMREEIARLPNCSCLETVRREFQPAGGKIRPLDTIRLEVLYSDRREWYASPGDRRFVEQHPAAFTGSGTTSDGYFALFLSDVISERDVSYEYKGEDLLPGLFRGRRLARYDYRIPANRSGYFLTFLEGTGSAGMKGSFWVDVSNYDIVRITVGAEDIPPNLPVLSLDTSIDYSHTNLGGRDFLLPQSGHTRLVRFSGEESVNHVEFTHCHLYGAQSSISFGPSEGPTQFGASSVLEIARELLPELQVAVRLSKAVTDKTPVGALLEGVVVGNVMRKGSIAIPAGSLVRGRLRRMERYEDKGGYYVIGLEFTDIEAGGRRYRFFADLEGVDALAGIRQTIRSGKRETRSLPDGGIWISESGETVYLTDLPGVGSFFVQAPRLELPAGFRMTWKTRALVP